MDILLAITLSAVWAAIAVLCAWSLAAAWRRALRDEAPLPIFAVLGRRGLQRLEQAPEALAVAVRRCALCREKARCRESLASGRGAAPDCPNALFPG